MGGRIVDAFIGGFITILVIAAYKYVFVDKVHVPVVSEIVEKA
jgi:hypothetical protein